MALLCALQVGISLLFRVKAYGLCSGSVLGFEVPHILIPCALKLLQ